MIPAAVRIFLCTEAIIPAGIGLPAYKKLQVVIDEKAPTFAPPTYARVQPAELVAVGDE